MVDRLRATRIKSKSGEKECMYLSNQTRISRWLKTIHRETNLDDVLQISAVYVNVSKGEQAKAGDLKKAFGNKPQDDIIKEVPRLAFPTEIHVHWNSIQILKGGELQVGEKEREHELGALRKDITHRVQESIVDPATQRPYSIALLEKALDEVGFSVDPAKNAKSQVLAAIKLLLEKSSLPVQRARMRVRITLQEEDAERLQDKIKEVAAIVEDTGVHDKLWESVGFLTIFFLINTYYPSDSANRSVTIPSIQRTFGQGV